MLTREYFCRCHNGNLDTLFFYNVYGCKECYYRFSSTDISLEEASHRMGLLHIFEDLEQDNFLFVRERERESFDQCFHELTIEWSCLSMSFTLGKCLVFFLHSLQLEPEKLGISEFIFRFFKCFDGAREVDIYHRVTFGADSFFLSYDIRDIVLDFG